MNIRGKHKLTDRWKKKIHLVVKGIRDSPVYVVKPETGTGPNHTLHRDLLLLCSDDKRMKDTQEDADDQEDEFHSDEDHCLPSMQLPEIIP